VGVQVDIKVDVKVNVKVEVKVGDGVGVEMRGNVGEFAEGITGSGVAGLVVTWVCVGAKMDVMFPSVRESEKPPRSKPMEARAIMIPRNTCRKFFITCSLLTTLSQPVSQR
jgi:hypothetical protein